MAMSGAFAESRFAVPRKPVFETGARKSLAMMEPQYSYAMKIEHQRTVPVILEENAARVSGNHNHQQVAGQEGQLGPICATSEIQRCSITGLPVRVRLIER